MFEIKVALLGHVSVGKTTVINALFQDKYSEVSMGRTTAGINRFYVSSKAATGAAPSPSATTTETAVTAPKNDDSTKESSTASSASAAVARVDEASSVLQQITSANKRLRLSNTLEEQTFHVVLEDPLCEMQDNTQLVLLDIPGLNEQGSREKYKAYVSNRWKTWDCVVLVMDAFQGVNSTEQVQLLKMIQNHYATKKKIPIIILCNKVDDPDEEERMAVVEEVQKKVEEIFKVSCRVKALEDALLTQGNWYDNEKNDSRDSLYPIFIPIAAAKAFLYRAASKLTLEEFQQEKQNQRFNVDELVRDEVGRYQWKKLSVEERYAVAHRAISDPSQYQERLSSTNFDKFLIALSQSVGGPEVQQSLIRQQLLVTLNDITLDQFIIDRLQEVGVKSKAIGTGSGSAIGHIIRERFWKLFRPFLEKSFQSYLEHMDLSGLSLAVDLLCKYKRLSDTLTPSLQEEERNVFQTLKSIVQFQCQEMKEKAAAWNVQQAAFMNRWIKVGTTTWSHHGTDKSIPIKKGNNKAPPADSPFHWERTKKGWKNKYTKVEMEGPHNPASTKATWQNLSPHDWNTILASFLLASYSRHFVEHFGKEKVELEYLKMYGSFATYFSSSYCVNCISETEKKARNDLAIYTEHEKKNGKVIPAHPIGYRSVFQVQQPVSLADPAHWGHVVWRFCNFVAESSITTTSTSIGDPVESDIIMEHIDNVDVVAAPEVASVADADTDIILPNSAPDDNDAFEDDSPHEGEDDDNDY